MNLQEDVNNQIAGIQAKLESAADAAEQFESTPVDLSEEIEAIPDEQEVSFVAIVTALLAICDAIDAMSGDTTTARIAIAGISGGSVSFATVKAALTKVDELMNGVSQNLDRTSAATGDHLAAGAGMKNLLIDQSGFDGVSEI